MKAQKHFMFTNVMKNLKSLNDKKAREIPFHSNGDSCTTLWKPSFFDKIRILRGSFIWVKIVSGSSQPPVHLSTDVPSFIRKQEGENGVQ